MTFAASPALAEVCDKAAEATPAYIGFVAVLTAASVVPTFALRVSWPSHLAAAIMLLSAAYALYELASGHPMANAAWGEGCGKVSLSLTVFCGVAFLVFGRWARRRVQN